MNKCFILALLFLLRNASAQDTISFQDHFDDNRNGWNIGLVENNYIQIKNGKFIYESKLTAQGQWSYRNIFFDPQKDFTLESTAMHVSGADNRGYGLVYGLDNGDNYQVFNLSGNSYCLIYEYRNKVYKELKSWTKPGFVHPTGTANKMKVQKKGSKIYYYINDQEVFQTDYVAFKGASFGFYHGDAIVAEYDDYALRQNVPTKINLVKNMKTGLTKQNLGSNVNTIYHDKLPVISPDGKTLFAARQGDPANTGDANHDDIWYSEQTPDGKWSKAVNMGRPLNNKGSNFVISITPDNNTLLLGNTYGPDGEIKGGGFSMSRKTAEGWSMPTEVKMKDYKNVHPYTSSYLANSGKIMILGAELPKTEGGSDIYVSFLEDNGEWSSPVNLGPTINTFGNDYTPFLASDGITLYYSTNGKRGYGDEDIFMSKRLDESWTKWSEPENLGPEINTTDFDAYFTIPASGRVAYVASTKNSIGKIDIFEVKLPQELKPDPVVMIYGKVLNKKTNAPIAADISYSNLGTGKEAGIASSNPVDGSYKIILPAGQLYSFHASKKDFVSVSDNIDLSKQTEYKEIERNLYLVPMEEGVDILLNNIFFETNKSDILPSSYPEMDRLADIMKEHPEMKIELSGHTDNVGSDADNIKLSQARSESVMKYLVNKGISNDRLITKGYGESRPVETNEHEAGRAKNRRMEFRILKKM
jgi:outer membrane protein OmpA-like peptidoglycan-associated protein